ncbi:hypothetical protein ABIA30_002522 [Mycobacterium sp. MAA66]|uniref:hypothetical protein n=1 Tax=Mycobacterium sp. MAA66 TaxID=3156297 RepID=UPI003512EAA5
MRATFTEHFGPGANTKVTDLHAGYFARPQTAVGHELDDERVHRVLGQPRHIARYRSRLNRPGMSGVSGCAGAIHYVLKKSRSGDIPYAVIQGTRHYSSQALFDYIMGHNKAGEKPANKPSNDPWAV